MYVSGKESQEIAVLRQKIRGRELILSHNVET